METKEERVTRQEGLLHNHKQEIPVETLCHRTFGERESFRIYIYTSSSRISNAGINVWTEGVGRGDRV